MKKMLYRFSVAFILLSAILISCCTDNTFIERTPWRAPDAALATINPIPYDVESVMKGKMLFEEHCQKCHGYWGEGNGIVGAVLDRRPANLLSIAGKKAEGEFAWKIAEGHGDMPSFRNILSQDDIWNIVNFVQSLENETSSGQPVARK